MQEEEKIQEGVNFKMFQKIEEKLEIAKNPVYQYIRDIQKYIFMKEKNDKPFLDYMNEQDDINAQMRGILVDWLVDVHRKFKMKTETLFYSITIMDKFLEHYNIKRNKL